MPPRPDPVESDNDDASEQWKHDDPTERSPKQRRQAEQELFDENQRYLYREMRKVYDKVEDGWRHPWRQK